MPTKHIDEETWKKVERETVKAVIETQKSIKDTEMLRFLILKGLKYIEKEDYEKIAEKNQQLTSQKK